MKPFLKWAGGKSRLVSAIEGLLPPSRRLVEPFMGSGAVFLGVERASYLVADVNQDLVALYGFLRDDGAAFIAECRTHFSSETNQVGPFMEKRGRFNALALGDRERAALFVYLNRHCFNGLCRYNSGGGFNVPFGRSVSPHFPEREMTAFARRVARHGTDILCQGFDVTLDMAREGDVVYCDPPYAPLSPTASFDAYAKEGFTLDQQKSLATYCQVLASEGVPCVISNHDTAFTRRIYKDAHLVSHDVRRSISGAGASRGKAAELFAVYLPDGMALPPALASALDGQGRIAAAADVETERKTEEFFLPEDMPLAA